MKYPQIWKAVAVTTLLIPSLVTSTLAQPTPPPKAEEHVVQTFRLQNTELKAAMTALRSIYGLKHIVADESLQTLTIRDTAERVGQVQGLLDRVDVPADEVSVSVALLKLSSSERAGISNDAQALSQQVQNHSLVASRLHALGGDKIGLKSENEELAVALEITTRVHPAAQEITLSLESSIETPASGSHELASSWRLASGKPFLVDLPGGSGDSSFTLVLTPKIVHAANPTTDTLAVKSSPKPALSPAQRAEIKERLKAKLAAKKAEEENQ